MPSILIPEQIVGVQIEELQGTFEVVSEPMLWKSRTRLKALLPEFDALIVRNQTSVTAELIGASKQLKVIGRLGVGLDNIDVRAAKAAGIAVVYAPEQNAISVSELVMGLMISLARNIPAADRSTKAGGWERQRFTGVELYGRTLGIVGLGRIGFRVGTRALSFGMKVIAHDAYVNPDSLVVSELRAQLVSLEALLREADFVTCHLPLTDDTRALFNYETFCEMKPTGFFINLSRGGVVDEHGLLRALQERRLAGVALDVRQQEPPEKGPLATMDNVILTPHIGGLTVEAQERVLSSVCQDVATVLNGGVPTNAVG